MKKIILDTLTSFRASLRNSTNYASSPHGLLFIPLILVSFALCQQMQGATDTPDPGPKPVSNTADGQNALLSITTGIHNTAIGFDALLLNSAGNFNTAVGSGTLLLNVGDPSTSEGIENTAVGAGALLSNSTGEQSTANGAFALFNNTEGVQNTATGGRALLSNTTGFDNTAIGFIALTNVVDGDSNTAIGAAALRDNVSGVDNQAFGRGALRFAMGSGNIAIGREAGAGITTGNNIITIGPLSGLSTTNGQVDDSCYIDNIIGAGVDAGTAALVFVDQDGKLGTTALPNTGNLPSGQALLEKVRELQTTVAQQAKAIDVLTAQLKEQAAQIQKVSAQLDLTKPAAQVVSYGQ